MKKILLHDQQYTIGGPKAVLDGITNSYLGNKYNFVRIYQREACGLNVLKIVRTINKYRKMINKEHADCIYICGLELPGFIMTIASRLSNVKKIVLSVHGSAWDWHSGTVREFLLKNFIETIQCYFADSVITVCESAQHTVGALKCCTHGNNKGVVYNTFPNVNYHNFDQNQLRQSLGIEKNKIVVTSVGRVVKEKGHAYIIEAIKKINDSRYVFVIVGDGPYLQEYRNNCFEEINRGNLYLLGQRPDVYNILRGSDIYLFSTLNENHSIALLEAVSMKCCALCTEVGGNPEIIENGVSGLTIPKKDSEAIVNGLKKLDNPDLRRKYADVAFSKCSSKFSIENTYGKLDNIFESY